MLESIWQLLANYGLDVGEIADGINSLFQVDAEGNVVGGSLAALADFPIIGMVLKAFASFAPAVGETVA
ncbi:MAG: hypothetical protein UGF89_02430 [Acutalibacteraceae bacterium]|nr:hypothetical protein [Acutalibacteraceae bacterium]